MHVSNSLEYTFPLLLALKCRNPQVMVIQALLLAQLHICLHTVSLFVTDGVQLMRVLLLYYAQWIMLQAGTNTRDMCNQQASECLGPSVPLRIDTRRTYTSAVGSFWPRRNTVPFKTMFHIFFFFLSFLGFQSGSWPRLSNFTESGYRKIIQQSTQCQRQEAWVAQSVQR